ncbi:MAG: hypothetical protein ACTHLW_13230, partial [Verrucomicrobiota bacterium]
DTNLYVGGTFTSANGVAATNIARWDGANWSTLESGLGNGVYALAMIGNNLYAAGGFTAAGSLPASKIAKWDGTNWSALGSGLSASLASALAVSGNDLYVGGDLSAAGGSPVHCIAKWDGTNWSALGSGLSGFSIPTVNALVVASDGLYVGGNFDVAGDKVSAFLAKATIPLPVYPGRFTNMVFSPITGFSCTFLDGSVGQPYRVQTSTSLSPANWTDFTNFNYGGPVPIADSTAGAVTNKFFRAVSP